MSPAQKRKRYLLFFLFIAVAVTAIRPSLRGTDPEREAQHANSLILLKELDASLDREVSAITSFQLLQYDPTVNTIRRLRLLEKQLKNPEIGFYGEESKAIDSALDAYLEAVGQKLDLIERIKSQAAVVRNGLHYLPVAVTDLLQVDQTIYRQSLDLLNQLYQYNLFGSDSLEQEIKEQLNELELLNDLPEQERKMLHNILFHIRANLTGLSRLGGLKSSYLALPTVQRFEALHHAHEVYRERLQQRASRVNLALTMFSLLLLTGLGLVLHKWDLARATSEQAWNRLHDAVESLSEAFALFDAEGRLVLHNARYRAFYPWLKGLLLNDATLESIEQANHQRLKQLNLDGTPLDEESRPELFLEQMHDGRWHLASNNRTTDGGLVAVRTDITGTKQTEAELHKLSRALEQSPASVVITNTEGTIEYVNPKFESVSGYTAAEAIGQNPRILKSGEVSSNAYSEMWQTLMAGKEWRGIFHNRRKDGTLYWESASISPLRNEQGEITHFIAVKEDITAHKRAEDQLRLHATVFETTTEGIMITDNENRVISVNPAFTHITGYSPEEVLGKKPSILKSGRHGREFYRQFWEQIKTRGHWSGEIWNRRKNGEIYPEWLSIAVMRDENGEITEHVGVFSDITKRKQDEQKIRYQANFDMLTGLPNRTLLLDRLSQNIAAARREHWSLALLFLDLDHFKAVNDSFGHALGDELLQSVAKRLQASTRESDTISRFGGDEFVILLQDIHEAADAALMATHLIDSLSEPFSLSGRQIIIGASIGITLFPADANNPDNLLQNADMAMYHAKDTGRNRYRFFTSAMQEQVREHLLLEQDLRLALEHEELELHYQPIIDSDSERPVAMEALLRWHHPEHGLVPPASFIPIAEKSGLIGPIGEWLLETACRQGAKWRKAGHDLQISVNLSSRQRELGLDASLLSKILQRSGLAGNALTLEITESLLLEDTKESIAWLSAFKLLGVQLSIDDFGTGYSSLSYLKRFPVDHIKIDRAFVSDLPMDADDASLVEAIVAMAHSLGHRTIAEGVESADQIALLKEIGCDQLQGFYYARPMPAAKCDHWLDEQGRHTTGINV